MSAVEELRRRFQEFRTACKTILPKVDPMLVEDVILRQKQNPHEQLMYTVEVFTDGSRDSEDVKKTILANTGMIPEIYDNATHYVDFSTYFSQKEVHSIALSNAQNAYTIIFAILNYMDSFLISAVIIPLVGSGMVLGGLLSISILQLPTIRNLSIRW